MCKDATWFPWTLMFSHNNFKNWQEQKKGGVFSAGNPPALIMRRLACIRKLMGQRRFEVEFDVRQSKSLTDYQRVQMNVISQNCILAHIL